MSVKEDRFERAELYEMVWSTPMSRLAKQFHISDVGLRKICKKLGVPAPSLGYWAKKANSKAARQVPLPKWTGPTLYVRRRVVDEEAVARRNKAAQLLTQAKTAASAVIEFKDDSEQFHPLVRRTERSMRKPGREDHGLSCSRATKTFSVLVSIPNLPRALRVLDALWCGLAARGAKAEAPADGVLVVVIDGEHMGLQIRESVRRIERELTAQERAKLKDNRLSYIEDRFRFETTGVLSLLITTSGGRVAHTLRDGREKLEAKLETAITLYQQLAIEQRLAREAAEAAARQRAEEQRIMEARRQVADRHLTHLKDAETCARQYERAVRLRNYALALERAGDRINEDTAKAKRLLAEVEWLRHAADWLDPTIDAAWPEVDGASAPYWWFQYQREMGVDSAHAWTVRGRNY